MRLYQKGDRVETMNMSAGFNGCTGTVMDARAGNLNDGSPFEIDVLLDHDTGVEIHGFADDVQASHYFRKLSLLELMAEAAL